MRTLNHQQIVDRLIAFQREVRDVVMRSHGTVGGHEVSHATAADTIYKIDTDVEPLLEAFCAEWAKETPLVLVAEGIEVDEEYGGEEGVKIFPEGAKEDDAQIRLIVDPIDGTREYLQGIPEYALSVGLTVAGRAVLGVVYNPATEELFAEQVNGAAEREPSRLQRSKYDVLVGRGEHNYEDIPPLPPGARVHGVGSVAYRLALLAAGKKGDAVLTGYGRMEWDVAAGVALCLAAGLRVTDVLGEPLVFNKPSPHIRGLLVAEPGLHQRIAEHMDDW